MDGYLDTKVAHRALELLMAQEELHSAQVPGSSIDERRLGAANGMGSVSGRIKPDFLDHESAIRAYCRVLKKWGDAWTRLGKRKSLDARPDSLMQPAKALRVDSVMSNCTCLEVFCCTTVARAATRWP